MPVAAELSYARHVIAEQRLAHYEAYEYQRFLLDELTDQSERLAAPMVNSFEYALGGQGLETAQGDALRPIFETGLRVAVERAADRPEWHFEIARRQLELEELDVVQAMVAETRDGRGPNALVVLSPHPDAVRRDNSIDGYDRHRKKLMVRIVEVRAAGARITSMSLDGSNYPAMQAIVQALGHELPAGLGSEEILAQRFQLTLDDEDSQLISGAIREAYDRSLSDQLGGEWYAGRSPIGVQDALAFIRQQDDLLESHMQAAREVQRTIHNVRQQEYQLEFHRFNLAAALDARLRGQEVDDLEVAGRTARDEGREFSRECPTMAASAGEQVASLGYGEQLCTCPFCFKKVMIDPCAARIKCPGCNAEVRDGVVVNRGDTGRNKAQRAVGKRALALADIKKDTIATPQVPTRRLPDGARVMVAGHAHIVRREVVLGGRETQLLDVDGKVTLRGKEAERLAAA